MPINNITNFSSTSQTNQQETDRSNFMFDLALISALAIGAIGGYIGLKYHQIKNEYAIYSNPDFPKFCDGLNDWCLEGSDSEQNERASCARKMMESYPFKRVKTISDFIFARPGAVIAIDDTSRIRLDNLGLSSLPPQIGQLTNTLILNLSHNQLTNLPPEICQLTNLIMLDLSFNPLEQLPQELLQLKELRWLTISASTANASQELVTALQNAHVEVEVIG